MYISRKENVKIGKLVINIYIQNSNSRDSVDSYNFLQKFN